jgi:hypothetical protein
MTAPERVALEACKPWRRMALAPPAVVPVPLPRLRRASSIGFLDAAREQEAKDRSAKTRAGAAVAKDGTLYRTTLR